MSEFLNIFTKIATDPNLGKAPAEALILVLSKSSDEILKNIKYSPVPLLESLTAIAKSSAKISPELMTKILGNDNLYSAAYRQGDLLKDIGTVSHVDGFELLARSLSYGNVNGLKLNPGAVGFRWELDSAAQLTRNGIEVEKFTKILLIS